MRRFEFPIDRAHANAVNETVADVRRLRASAIITTFVLGAGTAWLISLDHPWAYILAAVLAIGTATASWVALWSPRRIGSIEKLYADGSLVPAVVAEAGKRGVTIMALMDIAKPETPGVRYALVTRKVRSLPGHSVRPGERVPSISVLSDRSGRTTAGTWQVASPMPIAWATTDATVIEAAGAAIAEAEWNLLVAKVALSERVRRATDQRLLLDPHELPEELQ